jgi:acetyltransferase-like isoleucine patch superfamily enzyme
MENLKKGWFMLLELGLRLVINPYMRASLLRLFGARVGKGVRIYEIQLMNLSNGFRNLIVEDDVHIGMGCRIDLEGLVTISLGSTISPGVTIMTHSDPGAFHHSPLCNTFHPFTAEVYIGEYCWLGVNCTLLAGSRVQDRTVVGACSMVNSILEPDSVYHGTPAKRVSGTSVR